MKRPLGSFVQSNRKIFFLLSIVLSVAVFGVVAWETGAKTKNSRDSALLKGEESPAGNPVACIQEPVVTNYADSGSGSLRQAVGDACVDSTITFNFAPPPVGSRPEGSQIILSSEIVIDKSLSIDGGADGVTVSGNDESRIFRIGGVLRSATEGPGGEIIVTLNKLTMVNGASSGGGAILVMPIATLNLTNCGVFDNSSADAGMMRGSNSSPLVNDPSRPDGTNGAGGGILNVGSTLNITDTIIAGNSTNGNFGGGIFNDAGTVTVTRSTIEENSTNGGCGWRHFQYEWRK